MADKAQKSIVTRRNSNRSTRRDLLENLESRQLMAAFSAAFDFRPANTGTTSGFTADIGKAYSTQGSNTFGWNKDNSANIKARDNTNDGAAALIGGSAASSWDVAVPNGTYTVTATVGDKLAVDAKFGINAEGKTIVSGSQYAGKNLITGSSVVTVADGKLTLTSASGAYNNRITSVTIKGEQTADGAGLGTKPAAPAWANAFTPTTSSIGLNWQDASNNELGFIIERSTDGKTFTQIGKVGQNTTVFTASGLNANTKYYFRVLAYNGAGNSAASQVASTSTTSSTPTTTALGTVTNLTATASGTGQILVDWTDIAGENGYLVQRSTDNKTFTQVGQTATDVSAFTNTGLTNNTKYYYRIVAFQGSKQTIGSVASATTSSAPTTPSTSLATPSGLKITATTSSSIAMSWTDVANESGYIIERSIDGGKTFGEAGKVGANTTSYNHTGLNSLTKYIYRVKAYNSVTTSGASGTAESTTTAPTSTGGSGPVISGKYNKWALTGMVPNQMSPGQAIPILKDLGMNSVRLWMDVTWGGSAPQWAIDQARQYKNAGFTVTMCFHNNKMTSYGTAKQTFTNYANSGLSNVVDYWEIGNEPNHSQFWNAGLQNYVNNFLKPAYEALHAKGEKVVGGGVTYDVKAAQQLQSFGYSNYCDYAGFHPYGESGAIVIQRARDAKAAFGGKPLIVTEWNVQGMSGNKTQWAKEISIAAAGLSQIASQNYYYALKVDGTHVGGGGLVYSNGSKNNSFYYAVKSWTA